MSDVTDDLPFDSAEESFDVHGTSLPAQLASLCARAAVEHDDIEVVPTDYFFALPVATIRADGVEPSPGDQWKTTPAAIGALLTRLRDDGFIARMYPSKATDVHFCPIHLFLELGLPEVELMHEAEAHGIYKRVKRQWGGRYGYLRFTVARATVDLRRESTAQAHGGGPGIFEWCQDRVGAGDSDGSGASERPGQHRHRRFTSAERLRILVDKLELSTAVERVDDVDAQVAPGVLPGDEVVDGSDCCAHHSARAVPHRSSFKPSGLGMLRVREVAEAHPDDPVGLAERGQAGSREAGALAYFSCAAPVHETRRRHQVRAMWVTRTRSVFRQKCTKTDEGSDDNVLMKEFDTMHDYFGAKVALYFTFATQLSMWLAMPAAVGFAFFVAGFFVPRINTWLVPVYCAALMVWATLFAEYVQRLKEILVFRWGGVTASAEADEESGSTLVTGMRRYRPEYKKLLLTHGIDPEEPDPLVVSARVERTCRRRLRLLLSAGTMALSTSVVLAAMAANLVFRLWLEDQLPRDGPVIAGLVTGLTIQVLGLTFRSVAQALTRWECWRTDAQHEDALIAKIFVFECFNNYASLFHIAFVRVHLRRIAEVFGIDPPMSEFCDKSDCLVDLEIQLASILFAKAILFKLIAVITVRVTRDLTRFYLLRVLPCVNGVFRRRSPAHQPAPPSPRRPVRGDAAAQASVGRLEDSGSTVARPTAVTELHLLGTSATRDGEAVELAGTASKPTALCVSEGEYLRAAASDVVDEYKELVIMYGYIVLFASAFSLAPFLCLISTGLELRADAYKFCEARRPMPRTARHHPLWFDCAQLLTTIAVITNIALVLFTVPNVLPSDEHLSPSFKVGILLLAEHIILLARWMLQVLVPDKPMEVLRGMLESKHAFRQLHEVLLRADSRGLGGGGGLTNIELMQLGLHSVIARDLRHDRQRAGSKWQRMRFADALPYGERDFAFGEEQAARVDGAPEPKARAIILRAMHRRPPPVPGLEDQALRSAGEEADLARAGGSAPADDDGVDANVNVDAAGDGSLWRLLLQSVMRRGEAAWAGHATHGGAHVRME